MTQTYYSPFFPDAGIVGAKGSTVPIVTTGEIGVINTDIDDLNDRVGLVEAAPALDTIPPGVVSALALSSAFALDTDGSQIVTLSATWTPPGDADIDGYELSIQENGGAFIEYVAGSSANRYDWKVRANQSFGVKVRVFDKAGNRGTYSSLATGTSAKDSVAPAVATGLTVDIGFEMLWLRWTNPSDADLAFVEIWENTTNNSGTATKIATVMANPSTQGRWSVSGTISSIRYYWLKTVDSSGNTSAFTASANGTPAAIQVSDFTPGLTPVESVVSLPSTANYFGRVVMLQSDGKLYRWTSTSVTTGTAFWSTAVPTTDLTGMLSPTQISPDNNTGANSVINGAAETGDTSGFALQGAGTTTALTASTTSPHSGTYSFLCNKTVGDSTGLISRAFPVIAGRVYLVRAWVRTNVASGSLYMSHYVSNTLDANGFLASPSAGTPTSPYWPGATANTSWVLWEYTFTAQTIKYAAFYVLLNTGSAAAQVFVDDIQVIEQIPANVIPDGSLLAPKLVDGTISTIKIADNAINAQKILDQAITSAKFLNGLAPVERVAAKPSTANFQGRTIFLTTDGKLYRWTDTSTTGTTFWSAATDGADITANTITGNKIQAGTISAANLAANSVTATKIVVGEVINNVLDPNFLDTGGYWSYTGAPTTLTINTTDTAILGAMNATTALKVTATGVANQPGSTLAAINAAVLKLEAGTKYRFAFDYYITAGFTGFVGWGFISKDINGTNTNNSGSYPINYTAGGSAPANLAGTLEVEIDVPVGSVTSSFGLYGGWGAQVSAGTLYISNPRLQRKAQGNLIVDGSIIASKIAAGAVTTVSMNAGSINADRITANTIAANQLVMYSRGITVNGIEFTHNSGGTANLLGWTAGSITYVDNAGTIQTQAVSAGTAAWTSGVLYVYWTQGASTLTTTTTASVANTANVLPMASYQGGTNLVATYGRTIIDGSKIYANSVTAGQIAALTITAGQIAANTLTADKLVMSSRGLNVAGLEFTHNSGGTANLLGWTAGTITYVDNANAVQTVSITAGTAAWTSGVLYAYWTQGATTISTTTTASVASGSNVVPMATYMGGTNLMATYGRTIIDGSKIYTDSITASQIAASTITASELAADSVTANAILAGNITAAKIAVGAITADKLSVGIKGSNLIPNPAGANSSTEAWTNNLESTGAGYSLFDAYVGWESPGKSGFRITKPATTDGGSVASKAIPVVPGTTYVFRARVIGGTATATGMYIRINYLNAVPSGGYVTAANRAGTPVAFTDIVANGPWTTGFVNLDLLWTCPANTTWISIAIYNWVTGPTVSYFSDVYFGEQNSTTQIADGAITTAKMIAGSINGDRITAGTITAAAITAGTALAGSVTVSGTALSTIQTQANDPAARVNALSTVINPGNILISGATTLSNWRNGTDNTKIEGGSIAANTVTTNKLRVGDRNLNYIGIEFQWNGSQLTWTGGYILYTNDAGAESAAAISAGAATYSGAATYNYVYWVQGANTLSFDTANNYTGIRASGNSVILCTWYGGANYVANYGGTIVHGSKITTGSIDAGKINVGSLSAISADVGTVTAGVLQSSTGSTKLDLNNSRIIFNNGSYMKVTGTGFGSSSQFIEWYGPSQASVSTCTEANAIYYLKTNGSAYFGGTLAAGVLRNSVQTTTSGVGATALLGPFTTNGNNKNVTVSYNYNESGTNTAYIGSGASGTNSSGSAAVDIYYSTTAGASWTYITTLTISSGSAEWFTADPVPPHDPGTYETALAGSTTFNNNPSGATSNFMYKAVLSARTVPTGTWVAGSTNISQNVTIISIE